MKSGVLVGGDGQARRSGAANGRCAAGGRCLCLCSRAGSPGRWGVRLGGCVGRCGCSRDSRGPMARSLALRGAVLALLLPHVGRRGQGLGRRFLVHAVTWRTLVGLGGAGRSESPPLQDETRTPCRGLTFQAARRSFAGPSRPTVKIHGVSRFARGEGSRLWASLVSGRLQVGCFWKPRNRRAECAALRCAGSPPRGRAHRRELLALLPRP